MGCAVDITDRKNLILADKPIKHARELARAMIDAELEAREVMAVRSKAISKIKRHLGRKDVTADAPALSADEEMEFKRDFADLDRIFPFLGLKKLPLRERLERWVAMRGIDRGRRGTGAKELRPGIGAAACALLDWRHAQGKPITAQLEANFPKSGNLPKGAVPWTYFNKKSGEEVERLYHPSKTVRWLATELCLIDPTLSGETPKGRRPDWHLAYDWTRRWQEQRGLKKSSREAKLSDAQLRRWREKNGLPNQTS